MHEHARISLLSSSQSAACAGHPSTSGPWTAHQILAKEGFECRRPALARTNSAFQRIQRTLVVLSRNWLPYKEAILGYVFPRRSRPHPSNRRETEHLFGRRANFGTISLGSCIPRWS